MTDEATRGALDASFTERCGLLYDVIRDLVVFSARLRRGSIAAARSVNTVDTRARNPTLPTLWSECEWYWCTNTSLGTVGTVRYEYEYCTYVLYIYRSRLLSFVACMDDTVAALSALALVEPSTPSRNPRSQSPSTPVKSTGAKGPGSLPLPYIVHPKPDDHSATLVMLHGFTSTGKVYGTGWMPTLRRKLGPMLGRLKIVWLNAPMRSVSCYGANFRDRLAAWHDYFTDHGGDEGRPEIEEEIDVGQLEWSRDRIHAVLDEEARAFGGDYGRVAIGGASQGCCMALDAALTHSRGSELAGVFASCGQVYSCTPVPKDRPNLRIVAFHGAADRIIAASLAMRSYSTLVDAGFRALRLHLEPNLGHCEPSEAEGTLLTEALRSFGFFDYVPLSAQRRPAARLPQSPTQSPAPRAISDADVATTKASDGIKGQSPRTPASRRHGHGRRRQRSGKKGCENGGGHETGVPIDGVDGEAGSSAGRRDEAGGETEDGEHGELEILKAWYGDGDQVWAEEDGAGSDVTAHVKRLVRSGALRLNEGRKSGWFNERFSDTAPGTWKVVAVQYRYGEGELREVVSPKKANERAALIITPTRCSPNSMPPRRLSGAE